MNTRTVTANNIYLNYDDNITNILDLFPQTNDFNQQLLLKRNIIDSYDKNYINTLITNYYNKTETDNSLLLKSDKLTTYTKTETDSALALKANQSTTYTKTQVENGLALKANQLTTYTKTEVDTNLLLKSDKLTTYKNRN